MQDDLVLHIMNKVIDTEEKLKCGPGYGSTDTAGCSFGCGLNSDAQPVTQPSAEVKTDARCVLGSLAAVLPGEALFEDPRQITFVDADSVICDVQDCVSVLLPDIKPQHRLAGTVFHRIDDDLIQNKA